MFGGLYLGRRQAAVSAAPRDVNGDSSSIPSLCELSARAQTIRERIVDMCAGPNGGHLGGSMSIVEILTSLYFAVLNVDPSRPAAPDRDIFILSKGHGAIALYAALAERGFLDPQELTSYSALGSRLLAHPTTAVPGVEATTGSLGHGLSVAIGFALAARHDRVSRRCFCLLGDGELQEGSVWEAAMLAGSQGLERLVAIVDRNGLQITGATEESVRLEPLRDRWTAFGWSVAEVDGHDLELLIRVLQGAPLVPGQPTAVIARTIKGKGVSYIEGRVQSHFARLGDEQRQRALAAVRSGGR
jgi:transketolase